MNIHPGLNSHILPAKLIFASFLKGFPNPKLGCVTLHKAHPGSLGIPCNNPGVLCANTAQLGIGKALEETQRI